MTTDEIQRILEQNNYNIDGETYIRIFSSSPQIDHLAYNSYGNFTECWDNTGRYFRFKVYNREY